MNLFITINFVLLIHMLFLRVLVQEWKERVVPCLMKVRSREHWGS